MRWALPRTAMRRGMSGRLHHSQSRQKGEQRRIAEQVSTLNEKQSKYCRFVVNYNELKHQQDGGVLDFV